MKTKYETYRTVGNTRYLVASHDIQETAMRVRETIIDKGIPSDQLKIQMSVYNARNERIYEQQLFLPN